MLMLYIQKDMQKLSKASKVGLFDVVLLFESVITSD